MSDNQEATPVATGKDVTISGCEKAAMVFVGATVVNLAATFIGRKSK